MHQVCGCKYHVYQFCVSFLDRQLLLCFVFYLKAISNILETAVAKKSASADPVFEIDLSQDDGVDDVCESNEKNDETNTTASVQTHASKNKTSKPSVVSKPKPSPPSPQTSSAMVNKRQRTRSTGVRHKVSTFTHSNRING